MKPMPNIVKQSIVKILDGVATKKDYQNLINSFESQEWLIKLSPWGMRFYLALLEENKADKAILLRDMLTLFEAANYSSQSPQAKDFKATKGKVAKYEAYKEKLFNDAYDGTMDEEFLKLVKSSPIPAAGAGAIPPPPTPDNKASISS